MENIETEETTETETEQVFNYPDGSVFYREILTDGNVKKLGMPTKDPKIAESYGYINQYINESDLTFIGNENSGIYYLKGYEPAAETRDEMIARRQTEIVNMVQSIIDETAHQKLYDDGLSCVSYVGDPDEEFNADAVAFVAWRGRCWRTCYNILNSVTAGTVAPEDVTDEYVLERLPTMEWPEV